MEKRNFNFMDIVIRLIGSIVVLGVTAFITPGFAISSIWALFLSALVLTILDYLMSLIFDINSSPFGKGFVGFLAAVLILYVTQFFVMGYSVTIWGALIGAVVYGIIDAFIPGKQM